MALAEAEDRPRFDLATLLELSEGLEMLHERTSQTELGPQSDIEAQKLIGDFSLRWMIEMTRFVRENAEEAKRAAQLAALNDMARRMSEVTGVMPDGTAVTDASNGN